MSQNDSKKRMLRSITQTKRSCSSLLPRLASICTLASPFAAGSYPLSIPPAATFVSSPGFIRRRHDIRAASSQQRLSASGLALASFGNQRGHHPILESGTLFGGAIGHRRGPSTSLSQSISSSHSETETKSGRMDEIDTNDSSSDSAAEYFDTQKFDAYEAAIEEIISKRNVVRDFKKNEADLTSVKARLVERKRRLPSWGIEEYLQPEKKRGEGGSINNNNDDENLPVVAKVNGEQQQQQQQQHSEEAAAIIEFPDTKQKLRERSNLYLSATNTTSQHHKLSTVLLAHLADHCAKNRSPEPLYIAWEKILEQGLMPLSRTLSTYLYVLSLEGDNEDDGDRKNNDNNSSQERDIAAEVAMFHDALYEPTEKTITLLVKSLVRRGDARGAEALLDGIADGPLGQLRHRTTSPILKLYCQRGEIDAALRLYHRMRTTSRVKMDAATYADFIAAVAEQGYFRSDSECILGAEDLGYERSCGPELLDALITEMAEDVMDISEESARVLRNGLAAGFRESGLTTLSDSEGMKPTATPSDNGALVADRVSIDKDTAKCPATGTTLRLIVLEQSQRVHVHDTLLEMAREKSKEYTSKLAAKGRATKDAAEKAEQATQILTEFSQWLDNREGKPYTAIVDGANVAYFGWGKINVHQLVHMVEALENQGEHPLVVFPQKYTWKKFHLRKGVIQVLQDEELELINRLKEKDQMYVVPPMCLDDLYWMLASVSNQTTSTSGETIAQMAVPKNDASGRFPGLRPLVISNDKMRDHKMDLLEERAFRRWCCSHIVNYNFTDFIENSWEEREIRFCAADLFSDEIQGNERANGDGDGGGGGGSGMVWHFPVSEWDANERFCLRLPA